MGRAEQQALGASRDLTCCWVPQTHGYTLSSLHEAINLTFMQLSESLIPHGLVIVKHKFALNCWVWFYFSGVYFLRRKRMDS